VVTGSVSAVNAVILNSITSS